MCQEYKVGLIIIGLVLGFLLSGMVFTYAKDVGMAREGLEQCVVEGKILWQKECSE